MKRVGAILIFSLLFWACTHKKPGSDLTVHSGFAMGTTFIIEYDKTAGNLDFEIDRIFSEIEQSVVFSISGSLLDRINKNDSIGNIDLHFKNVLLLSKQIHAETKGAFDPTDFSLKQFWGKDLKKFMQPFMVDSAMVDSLKQITGFDKVGLRESEFIRKNNRIILNFDNIYKGYAVDQIADLFKNYNVLNYKIEVGGCIRAMGMKTKKSSWQLGIDEPINDIKTRKLLAIATLHNEAYATAGSYKNYYIKKEMKFAYTIDPATAYPVAHTLVAVSVFAPTCAEAQSYATAFMVMGVEKTKAFLNAHPQVNAYLISTNYKGEWLTFISDGLQEKLEFVKGESPI